MYREKDAEDGSTRKGTPGKAYNEIYGCGGGEDVAEAEVTEKDAEDRTEWRWKIRCGDH